MILIIFFACCLYPILPVVGHVISLCYVSQRSPQLDMLRYGMNINGCIKAPTQIVMTIWLLLKGVLNNSSEHTYITRSETQIPLWTIVFSFAELLKCTIQMSISNIVPFKKYVYCATVYFPFFVHSICFRALTLAFLFIYLEKMAIIPIFLIWLSNIIIGYGTLAKYPIPPKVERRLKSVQLYKSLNSESSAIHGKVPNTNTDNIPVWLNSFLSIFVPTCCVNDIDLDMESLTDKKRVKYAQLQEELSQHQKNFRRSAVKYQIQSSTTILVFSLVSVWYLVNYTKFIYNSNILNNDEFNIICSVILSLGIISYFFLLRMDIYDVFNLSTRPEEGKIILKSMGNKRDSTDSGIDMPDGTDISVKITENLTRKHWVVSGIFTCVVLSPGIIGLAYHLTMPPTTPAYVVMSQNNHTLMAKAILINAPYHSSKANIEGKIQTCDKNTVNVEKLLRCRARHLNVTNQVLLVDMNAVKCIEYLDNVEGNKIKCLPYKGIILLESWKRCSSKLLNRNTRDLKQFPILAVSHRGSEKVACLLQTERSLEIRLND